MWRRIFCLKWVKGAVGSFFCFVLFFCCFFLLFFFFFVFFFRKIKGGVLIDIRCAYGVDLVR